jgi:hypothetical protein
LISPALTAGTGDVSAIAAKQDAHVHLVSLALEPAKKAANAVPPIVFVVFLGVIARSLFAIDHKILVGLRQFLKRHVGVDILARTRSKQILVRFSKFGAAKNAHHALVDTPCSIWNRLV